MSRIRTTTALTALSSRRRSGSSCRLVPRDRSEGRVQRGNVPDRPEGDEFDLHLQHFFNGQSPPSIRRWWRGFFSSKSARGRNEFGFYRVGFLDGVNVEFNAGGLDGKEPFSGCTFHIRGISPFLVQFVFDVLAQETSSFSTARARIGPIASAHSCKCGPGASIASKCSRPFARRTTGNSSPSMSKPATTKWTRTTTRPSPACWQRSPTSGSCGRDIQQRIEWGALVPAL